MSQLAGAHTGTEDSPSEANDLAGAADCRRRSSLTRSTAAVRPTPSTSRRSSRSASASDLLLRHRSRYRGHHLLEAFGAGLLIGGLRAILNAHVWSASREAFGLSVSNPSSTPCRTCLYSRARRRLQLPFFAPMTPYCAVRYTRALDALADHVLGACADGLQR
jgi:hypothetical protein